MEESTIFYINSDDRLNKNDTHGNFTYELNIPHIYTHCCVIHANIPVSYYNIRNNKDTFYLSEDNGNTYTTITLKHGNYTFDVLKSTIETELNNNSPNNFTYTITTTDPTTEADTGKFKYTVTNNSGVQPIFKFNSNVNGMYEVMGFNKETSTYQFVNDTLETPSIIYLVPETNIFLHSDLVNEINNDVLQEFYAGNNINFSNIVYECKNYEMYSKNIKNNKQRIFHFYFTDEDQIGLDFNGINVVFTLLCYKKSNLDKKIKDYIKYKLLQNK